MYIYAQHWKPLNPPVHGYNNFFPYGAAAQRGLSPLHSRGF